MSEDLRGFYAEQDQVYYELLCGFIFTELKKSAFGMTLPEINNAIPESFRDCLSLVRLELEYMVKDGLVSQIGEVYQAVKGKTPPNLTIFE